MDDKDERLQRKLSVNIIYLKYQRLISDFFGGSKNLDKSNFFLQKSMDVWMTKTSGCKELLLNLKYLHELRWLNINGILGELSVSRVENQLKFNISRSKLPPFLATCSKNFHIFSPPAPKIAVGCSKYPRQSNGCRPMLGNACT